MSDDPNRPPLVKPHKPHTVRLGPVPVFNCVVLLSPPDAEGFMTGRVANLAGLETRGQNEREILQTLAARFKEAAAAHERSGEPLPLLDPPEKPGPGDRQRWIPVHL